MSVNYRIRANQPDTGMLNKTALVYIIQLLLDKRTAWVNGNDFRFISSMTVTLEVKMDEYMIIDFILMQIKKIFEGCMRER